MARAAVLLVIGLAHASTARAAAGAASAAGVTSTPARPRSVYRLSPVLDLSLTLGATTAIIVPYAASSRLITRSCPCNPDDVNAFDRVAIGYSSFAAEALSDVTVGAVLVVPLVLDTVDLGLTEPLLEDTLVFAETLAINGALVTATKHIVQRPLPRTYAGEDRLVHSAEGYRAFYSGHTATAFAGLSAAAMTLRLRHGEHVWPWLVVLVVGGSVAVERVATGTHFPSDVIVGALVGTATGIVVPWLHVRARTRAGGLVLAPREDGLMLGWAGRF